MKRTITWQEFESWSQEHREKIDRARREWLVEEMEKSLEQMPEEVSRRVAIDPLTLCWEWLGAKTPKGYGSCFLNHIQWRAHRLVFGLHGHELIDGMVLDHLCRNRGCVNPSHLRQVTQKENIHAPGSEAIPAKNARVTHCPAGHAYDQENTLVFRGMRFCKTCQSARAKARWQSRKKAS